MLSKLAVVLQRLPYVTALVRVNHFFVSNRSSDYRALLQDNYVFQHACKTPLTVLQCSLDIFKEDPTEELKLETIKSAESALVRLSELVNSVSSAQESNHDFEVLSAVQEVVILSQSKKKCVINLHSSDVKNLALKGRKVYFQEMLVCMINNAVEAYSPEANPHITVMIQRKRKNLHMHVIDFASGMSLVARKMACMQGVSYKQSGMGLGLYFVKRTVEEEFLGKLHIHSKLGMGTHIHVVMPVV